MSNSISTPRTCQRESSLLPSIIPVSVMAILCLSLLLSACGGSGEGLDSYGRPLSEQSGQPDAGNEVTTSGDFNQIQNDILDVSCATSGCHSGTSAPLGLNLDAAKSYDNLVAQPSLQVSGLQLVEPNNVEASYLVHKLEGTQSGGVQMPLGKPALTASQLALVRQWIGNGAVAPISSPTQNIDETGSDTDSSDESTSDEADTSTDEPKEELQARLDDIQVKVFDTRCTSCHAGTMPSADLNLEQGQSYSQLVERASTLDPQGMSLVSIGDPNNSFLIDKLRGRALGTSGSAGYRGIRMPMVGGYLSETEIQAIEQWITDGANEETQ